MRRTVLQGPRRDERHTAGAAIRAQGGEDHALRKLIINEICDPITAEVHSNSKWLVARR
jgi:hypothetical protein